MAKKKKVTMQPSWSGCPSNLRSKNSLASDLFIVRPILSITNFFNINRFAYDLVHIFWRSIYHISPGREAMLLSLLLGYESMTYSSYSWDIAAGCDIFLLSWWFASGFHSFVSIHKPLWPLLFNAFLLLFQFP